MTTTHPQASDASVAELIKQLSQQTSRLARLEVELAKTEMGAKAKRAGLGFGALGGAAVLATFAFGALIAAVIILLAHAVTAWLAAAIVAAALGAMAGGAALVGRIELGRGTPPIPDEAIESVQDDVASVREHAQAGRS